MEIIDGSDCSNRHRYPKKLFPDNILSEQLCATNPNATRFTCHVTKKTLILYVLWIQNDQEQYE